MKEETKLRERIKKEGKKAGNGVVVSKITKRQVKEVKGNAT